MIDSLVDFLAKEWTETPHTSPPLKRRFLKKIWWLFLLRIPDEAERIERIDPFLGQLTLL